MIDSLGCGGAEKSLISLLPFLSERNYHITLCLQRRGGAFEKYVPSNVTVIDFPFTPHILHKFIYSASLRCPFSKRSHSAEKYWKHIGQFYPNLREEYDIAIAYQQGFPTYFIGEKVKAKKKFCWINADLKSVGYSSKFCAPFYKKYDKIIAVSDILKDKILVPDYIESGDKIITCWDILNTDLILKMSGEFSPYRAQDTLKICSVGRLVKLKGFDLALDSAAILKKKGINFNWYIVGGGEQYNHLKEKIELLQLKDSVFLEGEQANPYPYIAGCDIYVQTSLNEGFGITIGEAKILRKPIVSTNFPVVFNQLKDKVNGIIVNKTPETIATGIESIINDPSLCQCLVNALSLEHNNTSVTESKKIIELIEN